MKLNCKQGDLAVIVGGKHQTNLGAIVSVERQYIYGEKLPKDPFARYVNTGASDGVSWVVVSAGRPITKSSTTGETHTLSTTVMDDRLLRPLRDNDGTDETLTWRDVPRKVAA